MNSPLKNFRQPVVAVRVGLARCSLKFGARLCACLVLITSIGMGATREVGSGQAYSTISAAVAAATAGDVINIHAGNYTETVTISTNNLTLKANTGDSPVLTGRISVGSSSGITITALTITGWASSSAGNYGVYQNGGTGLTVSQCNLTAGWGTAIYSRNSTNLKIIGNNLYANHNTSAADGTGIVIISGHSTNGTYATGIQLSNNQVYNNETDGIQIHGQYFTVNGNNVYNNITTNWASTHPDGIQFIAATADGFVDTQHAKVYGNIFRNQTQNIFVEGQSTGDASAVTDIQIWNNVVYCDSGIVNGVDMDSLGNKGMMIKYVKDCVVVNNNFGRNGNTAIFFQICGTGGIVFKNNIVQNSLSYGVYIDTPACVSAGNLDYNQYFCSNSAIIFGSSFYSSRAAFASANATFEIHGKDGDSKLTSWTNPLLLSGSPCIASGVALGAPYDVDFAGNQRPSASAWDMGAYVFGGVVVQPSNARVTINTP